VETWLGELGLGGFTLRWADDIEVRVTAGEAERMFGTQIDLYRTDGKVFYANPTDIVIPDAVSSYISGVLGFFNYSGIVHHTTTADGRTVLIPADLYDYYDFADMYQAGVNASGVNIGIVGEVGTGRDNGGAVNVQDIQAFWNNFSVPYSTVTLHMIAGSNFTYYGNSEEAMLDIEMTGVTAHYANITIVEDNDDAKDMATQYYDVWHYLVTDLNPDVISSSDDLPESATNTTIRDALHDLLSQAAEKEITIVAASGDEGKNGLLYPSADPLIATVGGVQNSLNSSTPGVAGQTGWSLSSGGPYPYYPKPEYQTQGRVATPSNSTFRDVPDIAFPAVDIAYFMSATPAPGENQSQFRVNGTSAAAPLFAGLVADAVAFRGQRLGFINPYLYSLGYSSDDWYQAFNDVTTGDNGYPAGTGWDYVTGIGTPDAWNLVRDLKYVVNFTETGLPNGTYWYATLGTAGGLSGWSYYKTHTVNPASGAGTGYQVNLTVRYGSGTDGPYDVYLNSHSRTDFEDVRFTASDGSTLLPYWIESYVAGVSAKVWVKVSADISSAPVTIYLYYGNPGSSSASDGKDTFLVFDDFNSGTSLNSTIWSVGAGSWSVSGGKATGSNSGNMIFYTQGSYQDARVRLNGTCNSGADDLDLLGRYQDSSNWYDLYTTYYYTSNNIYVEKQIGGSFSFISSAKSDNLGSRGTYHIRDFEVAGSHLQGTVDDLSSAFVSATDTSISNYGKWGVRGWSAGSISIDWIFISKYVQTEPTQGSWSSEVYVSSAQLTSNSSSIFFFNVAGGSRNWSAQAVVNVGGGTQYYSSPSGGSIVVPDTSVVNVTYYAEYYLSMSMNPDGSGSVSPSSGWHDSGDYVALTATDGEHYYFTDWAGSGCSSYTGNSSWYLIQMFSPVNETANFARKSYLDLESLPQSGVSLTGGGWYKPGTNVNVSATAPYPQYDFHYWTGPAYSGNSSSFTFMISSNCTETATFYVQLAMASSPPEGGSTTPGTGSYYYYPGSPVQISASPNQLYNFSHWSGDYFGYDSPHNFNINAPTSVTANFDVYLSLSVNPSNGGYLNVTSGYKPYNSDVTVMANSSSSYSFDKWSGDYTGSDNPHTFTMGAPINVTANFYLQQQQYYLTMKTGGSGRGTVSPSSGWHNASEVVQITATPAQGCYSFQNWQGLGNGNYTGTNNPAYVTMNGNITETGRFINGCRPIGGAAAPALLDDPFGIQLMLPLLLVVMTRRGQGVSRFPSSRRPSLAYGRV